MPQVEVIYAYREVQPGKCRQITLVLCHKFSLQHHSALNREKSTSELGILSPWDLEWGTLCLTQAVFIHHVGSVWDMLLNVHILAVGFPGLKT